MRAKEYSRSWKSENLYGEISREGYSMLQDLLLSHFGRPSPSSKFRNEAQRSTGATRRGVSGISGRMIFPVALLLGIIILLLPAASLGQRQNSRGGRNLEPAHSSHVRPPAVEI